MDSDDLRKYLRNIVTIEFSLVLIDSNSGSFIYRNGIIQDPEALSTFRKSLMTAEKSEEEYTTVAMGEIKCQLENKTTLIINPVFHPSYDKYKDLMYVNNELYYMPDSVSDFLEAWRRS